MTDFRDQRLSVAFGTVEETRELFEMVARLGKKADGFDKLAANPELAIQLVNSGACGLDRLAQQAAVTEAVLDAVDDDVRGRALLEENFTPDRLTEIVDVHGKNFSMLHAQAPGHVVCLTLLLRLENSLRNATEAAADSVSEPDVADLDDEEDDGSEPSPEDDSENPSPSIAGPVPGSSSHGVPSDRAARILRLDVEGPADRVSELLMKQLVICLETVQDFLGRKDDRKTSAGKGDWVNLLEWSLLEVCSFGSVLGLAIQLAADEEERMSLFHDLHILDRGIEPIDGPTAEALLCRQESLNALREEVLKTISPVVDPTTDSGTSDPDQLDELLQGIKFDL
jgi:hypothetical protein